VFGELPLPFAVFSYVLMCVANGLGWGVFCALARLVKNPASGESPFWWPAVTFCAVEFAWWSVFPAYFGASLYKVPFLMQGADLASVLGCSFLVLLVNGAVAEGIRAARRRPHDLKWAALGAGTFVVLWIGYGAIRWNQLSARMESARQLKVGMVQSNIGGVDKRGFGDEMTVLHQDASRELELAGAELIVWPETTYPNGVHLRSKNLRSVVGLLETPVLFGSVTVDDANREFNTALVVDAEGNVRGYTHKMYMVPFGEYLPFGETFPWLYDFIPAIAHLTPGKKTLPMALDDLRFATIICYEDILPYFVRRATIATRPHLIVNITNDSWYGDSTEQEIHLALATFRAVEMRRGLVRSTNTGISALVDPLGRITLRSGKQTRENLLGEIPVLESGGSLYLWLGDWLGWGCTAGVFGVLFTRARAQRRALKKTKKK
jgi:apolipoprotein N-acyltransferase